MKKYIQPAIEIEKLYSTIGILDASNTDNTPQPGTGLADGEAANQGFMSDLEENFSNGGGSLWDEN